MQQSIIENKKIFLSVLIGLIFGLALVFFVFNIFNMRVGKIVLNTDLKYTNRVAIEQKLIKLVGERFWLLNLDAIVEDLYSDIWLEKVEIHRTIAGILQVDILEKTPFAVWNNEHILDTNLEFIPINESIAKNLLRIESPKVDINQVGKVANKLLLLFDSYGIKLNKISYSGSGLWSLIIEDKIIVELGKSNMELRLNRFFIAWRSYLSIQKDKIAKIDLRYPNGLALTKNKGNL